MRESLTFAKDKQTILMITLLLGLLQSQVNIPEPGRELLWNNNSSLLEPYCYNVREQQRGGKDEGAQVYKYAFSMDRCKNESC